MEPNTRRLIEADRPHGAPAAALAPDERPATGLSQQRRRALVRLRRAARALGPAMARPQRREPVRAGLGAGLALMTCGLLLAGAGSVLGGGPGLILIAPLGATAFLLFAVPNSPLAQPWSAIVGNGVSATIAVTVVQAGLPAELGAGIAVCAAIAAMAVLRAMHPPGGAVALATVLSAPLVDGLGYSFVFMPVVFDTMVLVAFATAYNRLTGRKYPFRQPVAVNSHGTSDPTPDRRLGLSGDDLAALLSRYNLSANIGAEDFGRILAAAEEEAARRHFAGLTCGEVMSRDVISVAPDTRIATAAALFRRHRVKTLPVVGLDGRLVGIVSQSDLIHRASRHAFGRGRPLGAAMRDAVRTVRRPLPRVRDIMTGNPRTVSPGDSVSVLVRLLADGGVQAAPVVEDGRLAGIVTRSDLLAVLSRRAILPEASPLASAA